MAEQSGGDGPNDSDHHENGVDPVGTLDDALERVAHGATVSVPSILLHRTLQMAFTAVLTNGLGATVYGRFAVARRLQRFLVQLTMGFGRGLSRYLPAAADDAERDLLATIAGVLVLGVAAAFGLALFVAAPSIAGLASEGEGFVVLLRLFAVGLPASVWLYASGELLRGLELVGPLNLTLRVGFPAVQLGVGLAGVALGDPRLVAVGVLCGMALVGTVAVAWLARTRGLRPRVRGPDARRIRRQYLGFTVPLFLNGVATTTQRLGAYPLIVVALSTVAGGVFAVGVLVGSFVRLPLMGINQFIPPVAAALHDDDHRIALQRLYHVTSRLVLVGVTAIALPVVVYREAVMGLFGTAFVPYAGLLPAFVLAQYLACAAGSVGILLQMTDHQRALLVVNLAVTLVLAVVAVPLVYAYGLPGLVAGFVLMYGLNNGAEVLVLYHLEGLQPFTRRHAIALVAAVPAVVVMLGLGDALWPPLAQVAGTIAGLGTYGLVLRTLGFTPVERRLVGTLAARYRRRLPGR